MAKDKIFENEVKDDEALPESPSDNSAETIFSPNIQGKYLQSFPNGDFILGNYNGGQGMKWDQILGTLDILGAITADSGSIGGFDIGSDYIRDVANSFGLASTVSGGDDVRFWAGDTFANRATAPLRILESGVMVMTQSQGTVKYSTLGITWLVSTTENANIRLFSGSDPVGAGVELRFNVGGINSNSVDLSFIWSSANTGKLNPASGDTVDLGDSSDFFNEINYKTLTDRGCLGWFDEGVELQDGRKVSDVEAIEAIKKDPTKKTVYGVPMLDYSTMPMAIYKPAPIAEKDIINPETGEIRFKKGSKIGVDGAETTALISIMIGAIKELSSKNKDLEARVLALEKAKEK